MLTLYMVFGTAFCYYYYLLLAALPSSVLVEAAIKSAKNAANPEPVIISDAVAVSGGVAKLPCDITPVSLTNGDHPQLVIWYKDGNALPIYTFDARDKTEEQARHWSDAAALGGRAFFRAAEKPSKLTLEGVRESDGGVYRCRVDFKKSPTRNLRVNLTVIIPPERLNILDESGANIQRDKLGPYNEGSAVEIACIATGGRPPPRVSWWQENALLDDSWESISDRRVKNVLHLDKLTRKHLNAVFTCQASNNNLVAPISSAITLDLNLKPLWVKLVGENRPLSAEQEQQLSCESVGARPTPLISWWKGSMPLRNTVEETSADGNRTVSTLTFVPTMEDFGKFLSCRVETPSIPDSALEDGWKLNVHHVPVVTLELGGGLNASSIKEGVDVYFECNIKSNPWVYKVCWKHNHGFCLQSAFITKDLMKTATLYMGRDLMNNASAGIFVSNQSLVLQGVQKESAGLYTCVASNQEGDGESNPLLLSIRYAPVCRDSAPRIIGAAKGEPVKIPCEVEANPDTDLHFRWQMNSSAGQLVDLSPASYSVADRLRSVALFTPALEHDFSSQLICAASNAAGEQRQPCIFQLTPAGKPDQLTNCSIVNQTADALRIECMEGFDGGLTQQFVMEVYDAQTQMLVGNVTSSTAHFTIAQLHSGIGFDILLYAANGKGISRPTTLHAYTLKSAERRTAETPIIPHLTPLLGALIGVVVSLVLVLLAVLLALRLRGRSHFEDKTNEAVKGSSESADSLDKNPDIIPQNDDYQDADERAFEKLNSRPYVAHISADKPRGEVTYAELSLPSSVYSTLIRQKQQQHHQQLPPPCQGVGVGVPGQGAHLGGLQGQGGPPPASVVYSQIDPSSLTVETPLISHTRESATAIGDVQPPVLPVTATRF